MSLCKKCLITKAFNNKQKPILIDYKEVDNSSKNLILKEIINHGLGKIRDQFTVIVYQNRYRITIKAKYINSYLLTQEYMHFDSNNGYIPVRWRYVKIIKN